jgi:ribA/ribD-fused uncharacterized protein
MQCKIEASNEQASIALSVANSVNLAYEEQKLELSRLKAENDTLRNDLKSTAERLSALDNYSRRSNLIFEGIMEQADETQSMLLSKLHQLFEQMKIPNHKSIKLERYHRLGFNSGRYNRPVIIRFSFYKDRELIWSHKKNLKGSQTYVREDFCRDTLEYRQSLLPILNKAKSSGKRCVIVGDTLIIDGHRYPKGKLENLPMDFQPLSLASRSNETSLAFFGRVHPLSNFHPATFRIADSEFNCVEQFYQCKKALFFKDEKSATAIMSTNDPVKQLRLSKSIKDFCEETWEPVAKETMHNAILAKFSQNGALREFLCKTGDKVLLEASQKDLYWGTGCSLVNPNVLITSEHKGFNYLGELNGSN